MKELTTQDSNEKEVENMISILAFEDGVPFLSYDKDASDERKSLSDKESGSKTSQLEPATLVYHESARSIVFRDNVRRIHSGKSTPLGSSIKSKDDAAHNHNHDYMRASTLSNYDDESQKSHDSSSKRSRHRRRRKNNKDNSSLADSMHSVSSIDTSTHNNRHLSLDDHKEQKPKVVIANFQPQIDPLPLLELHSYNDFSDVLSSKPYFWGDDEGPRDAKINEEVWNKMNEKEKDVAEKLLHSKCVVKTIKKAEWTTFLTKFVAVDGKPRRYLHPADLKSATKEERRRGYTIINQNCHFNSFMTSTSLLPALGMKMRCYGSTKEYCHGLIFALPTDDVKEDETAIETSTWAWPSGM